MSPKNPGGQAPFGFKWLKGELVHEPEEASAYALIFDLFLVHQRKGTVARLVNERGLRTRAGNTFGAPTIKRLLENPVSRGVQRIGVTEADETGKPLNKIIEKRIPPIVSNNIWNHVHAILKEQSGKQTRPPSQDLFIGKVVCDCGNLMELPSKSSDYTCPSCQAQISRNDVLAIVELQLEKFSLPDASTLKDLSRTSLVDNEVSPERMLARVERDIEKLFSLHSSDAISEAVFKERFGSLETRKKQLQSSIASESPSTFSLDLIDHWQRLSQAYKRILVENIIDRITVSPSETTISLYPLFNFAHEASTSPPS